jgi:hypothetical protein
LEEGECSVPPFLVEKKYLQSVPCRKEWKYLQRFTMSLMPNQTGNKEFFAFYKVVLAE